MNTIKTIHTVEPFSDEQYKRIEQELNCSVEYIQRDLFNVYPFHENIKILICRDRDAIDGMVSQCPNLRMMFIVSAGVEKLPFDILRERSIIVTSAKGVNAKVISTYVMSYITGFEANTFENIENQKMHYWKKYQFVNRIYEKKLLLVGTGHIGQEIAKYAKAMNMYVMGIRRNPDNESLMSFDLVDSYLSIDKYIPQADYIVVCCPLTNETRNLFNDSRLRLMKQAGVFINVARSGLVDMNVLCQLLRLERIKAAVLDVFPDEPLSQDDGLWNEPKLFITPHSSGRTPNYMDDVIEPLVDNISAYLHNRYIPNKVNLINQY